MKPKYQICELVTGLPLDETLYDTPAQAIEAFMEVHEVMICEASEEE